MNAPACSARWLLALAVCAGCAETELLPSAETPSLAAGRAAGLTCSAVFLAKRELAAVIREELAGLPPPPSGPRIDAASRSVSVAYAEGEPHRLAAYREGLGCTTLPAGATVDSAAQLPAAELSAAPAANASDWPGGNPREAPAPPPALARVLADAFDGETYGDGTQTISVAVVKRGRLIAERYRAGFGPHTQSRTWSVAKTVTGALIGVAVTGGVLRVDAPAPIPEWTSPGDPRAAITIADLMHMSSGLERAGAAMDGVYFDGADSIREVTRAELEVAPGTRWLYSNRDTLLLVRALRHALGDDAYASFPRDALFERIDMRDTVAEQDAYGNFVLSSQLFTTARDLARFGLLLQRDGVWNGVRIMPEGWVASMSEPAPARKRGLRALLSYGVPGLLGYGAQLWLAGGLPFVPEDAIAALGSRGNSLVVVPSAELVVVRMGLDPEPGDVLWRIDSFVADVLRAVGD